MADSRRVEGLWFPRAREVEIRPEQLPELGAGDVQVRALASGISHGTEMLVYRGQVPHDLALDLPTLRGSFGFPVKYGYASVGRVVATGGAVQRLHEGDAVFCLHPHQNEYIVPESLATSLPPDLKPELGVFLANLETAVNVMLDAAPRLGERVLVFGLGVVGLLLVQLLRRAGAALVLCVDPLAARRALALSLGADRALAPDEQVEQCVRDLTNGLGADLVLEASGHPAALNQALDCVCFQGSVIVSSWYGTKPVTLDLGKAFHRGRVRLVSSQVGGIDPSLRPRWGQERRLALACDLLKELRLAPLISQRVPFRLARDAYALVDEHPEQVVQVILTYRDAGDGDADV